MHVQELDVDPRVVYVQVNLPLDVKEPMALLRVVEEPRGFLDREDPNGAPPRCRGASGISKLGKSQWRFSCFGEASVLSRLKLAFTSIGVRHK